MFCSPVSAASSPKKDDQRKLPISFHDMPNSFSLVPGLSARIPSDVFGEICRSSFFL